MRATNLFAVLLATLTLFAGCMTAPAPRPLTNVDTEPFIGRYAFDRDDLLYVRSAGSQISLRRTAGKEVLLDAVGPKEFLNRETGERYVFSGDTVSVGGSTATRTREASPFDILGRDVDTGVMNYGLLDPSLLTEPRLRARGLALLDSGNVRAAIALLKLSAERHPGSAAAHDALATAQLRAGDQAGARASSQKVLEVIGSDGSLTDSLQQLYRKRAGERLGSDTLRP